MIPVELYIVGGAFGGLIAMLREPKESRHEQTLREINRLERENRWLDAHNTASQMKYPPWGAPTR